MPLDSARLPGGNKINPRRFGPTLKPTLREGKPMFSFPIERADAQNTGIISDDAALICLQYATQWDWFAHVGAWFDADDAGGDRVVREGHTKVKRAS